MTNPQIFDGPLLTQGFIETASLNVLKNVSWVYASDILSALERLTTVKQIEHYRFIAASTDRDNYDANYLGWRFKIAEDHVLRLSIEESLRQVEIKIGEQGYHLSEAEIQQVVALVKPQVIEAEQSEAQGNDITAYITGRYRQLKQYISLQHEFPELYKLTESRLDGAIASQAQAELLQFKGFLTLFDQVLADQTAQLENLKYLLALPEHMDYQALSQVFDTMLASEPLNTTQVCHFWQAVRQLPRTELSQGVLDVSGMRHLLADYFATYQQQGFQTMLEAPFSEQQLDRLQRSLTHLLARYAESLPDVSLLKYGPVFANYQDCFSPLPADMAQQGTLVKRLVSLKRVVDHCVVLSDYPSLSRDRSGGFNYLNTPVKTQFVPSLAKRLMRFLGCSHLGQMPLSINHRESFYLLEANLLRHRETDPDGSGNPIQTGSSNQLYFVLPSWPTRFANDEFRAFLQTFIRQETPVHCRPYLIYLSRSQMSLFEQVFYAWLNALSQCPVWYKMQHQMQAQPSTLFQAKMSRINLFAKLLRSFITQPIGFGEKLLAFYRETTDDGTQHQDVLQLESAINAQLDGQTTHLFSFQSLSSLREDLKNSVKHINCRFHPACY